MKQTDPQFFPLTELTARFVRELKQCQALGIRTLEGSEHHVLLELPYNEALIGYPETRVIHGGVITTLMDTACGAAVACAIASRDKQVELSPTLDLRVDYMKPAEPDKPVFGFAECYKLTGTVAFVRGIAYQDSVDDPVAQAVGAFMRIGPELVTPEYRRILEGE